MSASVCSGIPAVTPTGIPHSAAMQARGRLAQQIRFIDTGGTISVADFSEVRLRASLHRLVLFQWYPSPLFALPCNSTRERVSYPFIAPLRALPHRNFSGRVRKRRLFSLTDRCALSRNDLLIRGERGAIQNILFRKTGKIIGKSYALRGNTVIIYLKKAIDDISSSS